MTGFRRSAWALFAVLAAAAVTVARFPFPAEAQGSAALPPSIIQFAVDLPSVALPDIEAGNVKATLSWQTVGMTDAYRLLLYYFSISDWVLVRAEGLPPSGSGVVPVIAPLDFGPPMFRLAILDRANQIISQQVLAIPYDRSRESALPVIEVFSTDMASVNYNLLALNQTRVRVIWKIANRYPSSNLVFEQVMPDGSGRSVELPRLTRWINSSGEGLVAPSLITNDDTLVRLRLRIVDFRDERVLAERELLLPIVRGTGAATATLAATAPFILPLPSATPGQ